MLDFKGKNALIVGGAGFVGSNLSHMVLEQGLENLTIVDNLLSSDSINIPIDPRVNFIFGSIADDRILQQLPEDLNYVWHLACYHGNQSSIADPIKDHANNNITSLKLFDYLSKRKDLTKVIYSAAGCAVATKTYGEPDATDEDAPVSLFHDSPYSISKLAGELYGNFYFQQYGFPFVRARFQNVYGPREILGAGQWRGTPATIWRNVIPSFVWKSINGEELPLENGGKNSRDFIYVDDICRGLISCAIRGVPGEAYNLATGIDTSIFELATQINRLTGNQAPSQLISARNWDHSGRRFGSTKKSRDELGFTAEVNLLNGLEKTIDWTRQNYEIIQNHINKHQYFIEKL